MAWPTTDEPKTEFVTVRFTLAEAAELDAAAQIAGQSRSAHVRDCCRRVHEADRRKALKLAGKTEE